MLKTITLVTHILEKNVQESIQEHHQNILNIVEEDGIAW